MIGTGRLLQDRSKKVFDADGLVASFTDIATRPLEGALQIWRRQLFDRRRLLEKFVYASGRREDLLPLACGSCSVSW